MPKRRKKPPVIAEAYWSVMHSEYDAFNHWYHASEEPQTETAKAVRDIFGEAQKLLHEDTTMAEFDRVAWMKKCMAWPIWMERN